MRIGLIGFGAIAGDIYHNLKDNEQIEIVSGLVLPEDLEKQAPFPLTVDFGEFIAADPDLVGPDTSAP